MKTQLSRKANGRFIRISLKDKSFRVLGYVDYYVREEESKVWIDMLHVDHRCRNRGFARELVLAVLKEGKRLKMDTTELYSSSIEATSGGIRQIALDCFYARMGFVYDDFSGNHSLNLNLLELSE